MFLRYLLLVFGVFACSTAVIMIKATDVAAVPLSGYRQLVAAVALLPLLLRDWRRTGGGFARRYLPRTILPGALLGVHFISWIIGARKADSANASLIVNLVPVAMPLLLIVLTREMITRGEAVGTLVAMGGVGVLAMSDYHLDLEKFWGDVICFGSMLLFATYLALGRRNRDFPSIWLYLVPLYFVGGVLCVAGALILGEPMEIPRAHDWLMVLGLGVIPTVMGHSILNYAMKHLRGQTVSIANLGQFIFAGVMAWLLLEEVPNWGFYLAVPLTVGGTVYAMRHGPAPNPKHSTDRKSENPTEPR
jgi:drug/metabolite transporter (DMT)-like permease